MIFYIVLAVFLILFIFYSKKKKPARLNMRKGSSTLPDLYARQERHRSNAKTASKSLDCFFMYNGHEFNAYDVLEVPAGAPREMLESAFKEKMADAHPSQKPFYRAAFEAALVFAK